MAGSKTTLVQIQGQVEWEGFFDRDSSSWIGICRSLNLNAIADTYSDLQKFANEVMQLLLEDVMKAGELEAFLREHGWRTQVPVPEKGEVRFDVPSDWRQRQSQDGEFAYACA